MIRFTTSIHYGIALLHEVFFQMNKHLTWLQMFFIIRILRNNADSCIHEQQVFQPLNRETEQPFIGVSEHLVETVMKRHSFYGISKDYGFGTDFSAPENMMRANACSKLFFKKLIVREMGRLHSDATLGYDPRVYFELSRFCTVPIMAFMSGVTQRSNLMEVFTDDLFEWIRKNPIGYGLNWVHAMEAAIRAANWCLGYHILSKNSECIGKRLQYIEHALEEHGRFIRGHLEKKGNVRNNHYLANLTGLLYISSFLKH